MEGFVSAKVYVGNLSFKSTEEDVRQFFSKYGNVISVSLITDRDTGRPRGFGFVEMDDISKAVTEANGKEFAGRALVVNEAKPRSR
jgi:RNA recognition motif-containing protein